MGVIVDIRLRSWLVAGLALGAAALAVVASHPYPGVTVDSGEYLAVSEGLAAGRGLTMPYVNYDEAFRVLNPGERVDMTQFPPLYPAVLALLHGLLGMSTLDAARVVGAVGFGALVAIVCALVGRETRSLFPISLAAALLAAPDLLTLHAMAWSETIMLASVAASLYFANVYLRDHRARSLVLAGLFGVIATMARFAGVAVLIAVAFLVLRDRERPRSERIARASFVLGVGLLPTAAWFVRNLVVAGYASEKTVRWHPPAVSHLTQAAQAVGSWLVPGKLAAVVVGVIAIVAGIVYLARRARSGRPLHRIAELSLVFGAVYLLFMVATKTLLDQNISLDGRILSPLHVALVIAICCSSWVREPSRWGAAILIVVAAMTVGRGVHAGVTFSSHPTASYTNDRWRASETLAFAGSLPAASLIITNAPDPVWLWHGRNPQVLPPLINLYTGERNERYTQQMDELKQAAACRETFLLFFEQPTRKPPREIPQPLVEALDLRLHEALDDGAAYVLGDLPACARTAARGSAV